MASPVAVLDILVRANTGAASAQLTTLDRQLKGTAATANATSTSLGSRLAKGAKYGALAMGALGAVSVKTAVDFDKSMRNVNSIAQLSEKQLAKLEDQVKSLAGRTAQSPQTLAEGLYDLVSSGFDANESMKVLAASAKAATAGLTTTEVSTKAVAASLNAYRMPASRAKQVSDVLFRTVDRGVVSFEELSSTIGDVLPFASSLGVKLNEVGAATATMTKAGISPAETMTRLKAIMSSLLKPSEALTATLKQMGYESGEQIIKAKGLEGTLLALAKATGGSKTEMAALFPNIRALGGALALTGENAGAAKKDLDQLRDSAGATNRALAEQSKSVAFQWNKLKAQAQTLAIDIGDKVIPALRDMLEILTNPKLTLDEKISKLGVRLTKMIEHWAPKVAEAGGRLGLAIIKGIWDAFWHSDLLGKLFIGGAFLRLLGGPGVFGSLGAKLAGWLFAGFGSAAVGASGAGAGAAGGAAAGAASSLATGLRTMIGRAGIVGLGVMAGSSLMKGISDGIARSSGDVQEALEASIPSGDITKNILSWNGPGIIESIFGASDETKHFEHIRDTLNHILKARVGISEQAKAAIMDEGRLVGLTDKQLGQAERVLDYGTTRLSQAEQLRDVFKNANIDLTGEDLLPQATVDQVTARMTQMRKGMFTAASQIQKVMAENRKNIRSLGLPAEQTRKMLTSNMRAGAKAMREALRNGSIKGVEHIREARKKIKHLLRSADLVEGIHPRDFGQAFAEAIKAAGGATKDGIRKIVRDLMKMPKDARNAAFQTMMAQLREYQRGGKLSDKEFKDIRAKLLTRLQGITSDGREQSIRFKDIVSGNFGSLATSIWDGLKNIGTNVGKVLDSFQVKWQKYSLEKPKSPAHRQHGGLVPGLTKGALVPGTGSGDKVPLHIGGQLAAMVEPNELVSVTNRTATAALMAHNRRVPRRAQGGMVDPAGPGTGLVNEAIAGIVGRWSQRFNAAINYGYDPGGGHLSPGHNVTGTATDTGPAGGWGAGPTRLFEQGLKLLLGSGLTVLYGSHGIGTPYPNHGYGNHAHIEWGMHPVIKGLGAAAAETIKRILLKGPKGPLRDMGQSALDKTRKAASAYLAKHSGGMMGGDIGAPIRSLPEALQKYNRTYAEHNSAEGDWGGYRMPFNAVAALAEWAGAPGVSMARTAIGESNLRPGATGVDRGGTKGYGLWMITTSFNDDLVKPYGGYGQMLNPVLNAQVMNKILDRQGYGAWYSDTLDTSGTHYNGPLLRKYGGLVPHLAKGGKAGDKPLHGTATPGPVTNAFKRFRKARRIAKQLKDLLGERGRVARVDERIANAEALAGLASSEAGSEMSPKELARQIRLNELLLANLVKARKLARSGLGLTRWPKGMSVDKRTEGLMKGLAGGFRSNLVDLTGLTGAGGRIFETKNIIDELKHTTGAGPAALDISGLRSVIEAARYGVFDGYFARGGNLKPGRWGIAGERGPEVVHGPSTVLSPRATQDVLAPKVEVHNEFDFDGLDLYVTTKVNGEIAKRERVNHRRGRQAVR